MLLNHQLRVNLIKYLSNIQFKNYEFKDIFNGFIESNPDFKNLCCYQKAYSYFRVLEDNGYIILTKTHHHYKYTSNYTYEELVKYISDREVDYLRTKNELDQNIQKITLEIHSLQAQIVHYDRYVKLYPNLSAKIVSYRSQLFQTIVNYEAEIKVVKNLISII